MVATFRTAGVSSYIMTNINLLRRLIFGSLILGAVVPMIYHISEEFIRVSHFKSMTKQACKVIEPMIQRGSQREPLEYLNSTISAQGGYANPEIVMKDHDRFITSEIKDKFSKNVESCIFSGISDIEVKVYYSRVPMMNITYLYLYLLSVPAMFGFFVLIRRSVLRLQRKIADIIEWQMKKIFNLSEDDLSKPRNGFLYRLLDLEIPLLGYLKKHIESLESDLQKYSQKIAEQQRKEVLKDVASQMAHEILTPISTLQTILKDPSALEKKDVLLLELAQIKSLSENLLREYRGDKSIPDMILKKFDVHEVVKSVVDGTKIFASQYPDIKFELNAEFKHEKIFILADRSQFVAAISNLLRNSVEAMIDHKGLIQVNLLKKDSQVVIVVKDNGCGIKFENLDRIFDKKFSEGKANGTGLGLYQVKSAIELMNGYISVSSRVHEYTEFEILIPIAYIEANDQLTNENVDLVLIDDSYANHLAWQIEAKRNKKAIATFYSESDFLKSAYADMFSLPIFVDCIFGDEMTAGQKIVQNLKQLGFQNLSIATGLESSSLAAPSGVKVVGKEFPLLELN